MLQFEQCQCEAFYFLILGSMLGPILIVRNTICSNYLYRKQNKTQLTTYSSIRFGSFWARLSGWKKEREGTQKQSVNFSLVNLPCSVFLLTDVLTLADTVVASAISYAVVWISSVVESIKSILYYKLVLSAHKTTINYNISDVWQEKSVWLPV